MSLRAFFFLSLRGAFSLFVIARLAESKSWQSHPLLPTSLHLNFYSYFSPHIFEFSLNTKHYRLSTTPTYSHIFVFVFVIARSEATWQSHPNIPTSLSFNLSFILILFTFFFIYLFPKTINYKPPTLIPSSLFTKNY